MREKIIACLSLVCLFIVQLPAFGFTQGVIDVGSIMPVGHEWITREAAIEVLGGEKYVPADPKDPRLHWPAHARASHLSLAGAEAEVARIKRVTVEDPRAAATYKAVADAIIGERWVDIGGVNITEARAFDRIDCFDSAVQEPSDIQYDHFMRRPDDANAAGGVTAAQHSGERFVKYFVAAAMAPDGEMEVWDGGAFSALEKVDRHYFLFGRALHLFQDSFSLDHTVRMEDDYYRQVRQVKSYLCAAGSQQHAHTLPTDHAAFYRTGDVIWISAIGTPGWLEYIPSNIKGHALAAIEGSKDVWAAFIRTMAKPRAERAKHAHHEATELKKRWLGFDETQMLDWYKTADHRENYNDSYVRSNNPNDDGGNGTTQQQCMDRDWNGVTVKSKVEEFKTNRRKCLYNMVPNWGEQTDFDHSLHLAYDWNWRADTLETPPDGWEITHNDNAVPLKLKLINRANGQYMRREGDSVYNDRPDNPEKKKYILEFAVPWHVNQPATQTVTLPVVGMSDAFLNRLGGIYGLVTIKSTPDNGHFSFERRTDGYYNIRNVDDQRYMYMDPNEKDYISKSGKAENKDAQWRVEGLPEPYPGDGTYYFQISNGNHLVVQNGQLMVVDPSLGEVLGLERQPDGTYKLKMGGAYIGLDPGTRRLVTGPTGTTFRVQQQSKGTYTFRSMDGTFWGGIAKPGNPILSDASAVCPAAVAQECHLPLTFVLTRQWN